tara:strand:+ start:47 stop:1216 length:1170 start_codon:yes stop_codon:yes gene_type:complete
MAELRQNIWTLNQWYAQAVQADGSTDYSAYSQSYVWGGNNGSFGNGSGDGSDEPVQIPGNWKLTPHVAQEYNSSMEACAMIQGTNLYTWGQNQYGQVGKAPLNQNPTQSKQYIPGSWSQAAASQQFMGAINTDGELWMWGLNENGQLGQNHRANRQEPFQVGTDTTWQKICVGYAQAVATKTDGTLWAWGDGAQGAVGNNKAQKFSSPVQIGTETDWSEAGLTIGRGACGAIKTDGTAWVWGANFGGQMGVGIPHNAGRSSPTQISGTWGYFDIGKYFGIGAQTNGGLYSWGTGGDGQLGQNQTGDKTWPTQIGTGTDWATNYGACTAGSKHGGAVKTDGTLWVWGNNGDGRLGLGNNTAYSSPKQVGTDTTWYNVCASNNNTYAQQYF